MSADDPGPELRRAVGDELRSLTEALCERDAPDTGLAAALEALRAARSHLDGPPRASYNGDDAYWSDTSGASWQGYVDWTPFGGGANPLGQPAAIEHGRDGDGRPRAVARVRLGQAYQGGPGMVHGGYVAGLLDHVFGLAMHAGGLRGVTAALEVRYLTPTPIRTELAFEAVFEPPSGRRLVGRATCRAGETLTAEAVGRFVTVDMVAMSEQVRSRYH